MLGEGVEHPALGSTTGLSNNKMGMWLFLGSECLLFGGLISTYMLYRGRNAGLGPDQIYDIPFTSVSSFVLLMSSLTMVLAVSAINRHDERNTKVWLVTTALLGATFVGGQVYEFTTFYREGLGLHDQPVLVQLLHVDRVPRRARVRRHRHAAGAGADGPQEPGDGQQGRGGRARRPLLALRRHRLDRHLHPRLPDPGVRRLRT